MIDRIILFGQGEKRVEVCTRRTIIRKCGQFGYNNIYGVCWGLLQNILIIIQEWGELGLGRMEVVLEFAFPCCFREEIVSSIQPNDSIFQITFTFVLDSSDLEKMKMEKGYVMSYCNNNHIQEWIDYLWEYLLELA